MPGWTGAGMGLEPLPVGTPVRCRVSEGDERVGRVLCWDPAARILVIQRPLPNDQLKQETTVLNMGHLLNVEVIGEVGAGDSVPPPSRPDFLKLKKKMERELGRRSKSFLPVPVAPFAQRLFHAVQKTLEGVEWREDGSLVVMKTVEIRPPFAVENVEAAGSGGPRAEAAVEHVRKIVSKEAAAWAEAEAAAVEGMEALDPAIVSASFANPPARRSEPKPMANATAALASLSLASPPSSGDGDAFHDANDGLPQTNPSPPSASSSPNHSSSPPPS